MCSLSHTHTLVLVGAIVGGVIGGVVLICLLILAGIITPAAIRWKRKHTAPQYEGTTERYCTMDDCMLFSTLNRRHHTKGDPGKVERLSHQIFCVYIYDVQHVSSHCFYTKQNDIYSCFPR